MQHRALPQATTNWFVVAVTLYVAAGLALLGAYAYFWYAYLFLNRWPSQEQMVASGYRMIPQAKQIDDLFGPAWHRVSNYREPDTAEWQTEALFGGRYEMWMTVTVRIDRRSGSVIQVIGEPRFLLLEVQRIERSGAVAYPAMNQHEFGADKWQQVVNANGDFSVIGIQLNRNNPVPGWQRYVARPRNGLRMVAGNNEGR